MPLRWVFALFCFACIAKRTEAEAVMQPCKAFVGAIIGC